MKLFRVITKETNIGVAIIAHHTAEEAIEIARRVPSDESKTIRREVLSVRKFDSTFDEPSNEELVTLIDEFMAEKEAESELCNP
jgi:hypothetical protein